MTAPDQTTAGPPGAGSPGGAPPPRPAVRSALLLRLATYASVAVASLLVVVKFGAWMQTGSVAVLSSLIDSLLDVAASAINMAAVAHALTPADREHRFGHGKAEAVAGLGQAALIAGSAVFLIFQAGERLVHPQPVENSMIGIAVMVVSIAVTAVLVAFQRYVVAKTKSVAIAADSLHYVSDLLSGLGVIAALLCVAYLDFELADPLFALAIAAYILYSARVIVLRSWDQIMDREMPDDERAKIRDIVLGHPDVMNMHDMRTRVSGTKAFIQLHLELDGQMTLERAHAIADEVEALVGELYPDGEVLIHQDPAGLEEPPVFA